MSKLPTYTISKGEVLAGSGLLKQQGSTTPDRVSYMLDNMSENDAFLWADRGSGVGESRQLLSQYTDRYSQYRKNWVEQPKRCIREKLLGSEMLQKGLKPLCIDIETAAICDLACPFCYRQYHVTPDKLIDPEFCYSVIDQAAELGVPSIKFNWRGEPLLHPKLPDFIAYAKSKGILETLINTNATELDEQKSKELIESGLDFMIYSFDGGTEKTYEKMRPGRFKENNFSEVYENIKRFHTIKSASRSALPYTKIQMILTDETFNEMDSFFALFSEFVDDVSTSQYTERGGQLNAIDDETKDSYEKALSDHGLPIGTPYIRDPEGRLLLSKRRKACEQPFQRLLVTYEGRVGMCCYDWGATHPVGYLKPEAYQNSGDYDMVLKRAKQGTKGFELLANIRKSKQFNHPDTTVQTLAEIWCGREIDAVRNKHISGNVDDVEICRGCDFKDTYEWFPVSEKDHSAPLGASEVLD